MLIIALEGNTNFSKKGNVERVFDMGSNLKCIITHRHICKYEVCISCTEDNP